MSGDDLDPSQQQRREASSAEEQRKKLQKLMGDLAARGVDCGSCSGVCCTFVANSMQIGPGAARRILAHLQQDGRLDAAMIASWRQCVANFNLDRPVLGDGRRTFSRRRYTCPFYSGAALGCALPSAVKPLGCLAFNPNRPGVLGGEDCGTPECLRAEVDGEVAQTEAFANGEHRLPIPQALLLTLASGEN